MRGSVLVAPLVRVGQCRCRSPVRKPWSRSTSTEGWLIVQVEHRDLGVGGLVAQRRCGPLADQQAGLEVVGGEGGVGGVDRVERRVERDDQNAGVARGLATPNRRSPWCRRR
jgi:hypothetical protein